MARDHPRTSTHLPSTLAPLHMHTVPYMSVRAQGRNEATRTHLKGLWVHVNSRVFAELYSARVAVILCLHAAPPPIQDVHHPAQVEQNLCQEERTRKEGMRVCLLSYTRKFVGVYSASTRPLRRYRTYTAPPS